MILGHELDLCLSNYNTLFLLTVNFRFLNIRAYFNIILPYDSSSKFLNKYLKIAYFLPIPYFPFPSHPISLLPILYLIILTQSAVNTQSS